MNAAHLERGGGRTKNGEQSGRHWKEPNPRESCFNTVMVAVCFPIIPFDLKAKQNATWIVQELQKERIIKLMDSRD